MDNKNILTENKKHLQLDLNHLHKKKRDTSFDMVKLFLFYCQCAKDRKDQNKQEKLHAFRKLFIFGQL